MASENTVTLVTPCREYRGARNEHGYGVRSRSIRRLHRWVVAQVHGEEAIRGKVVMHLCDNPPCFRYDHLRIADRSENNRDSYRKGRKIAAGRKLTDQDRLDIANSDEPRNVLSERYGVSGALVTRTRGARPHSGRKLTDAQVAEIRSSPLSNKALAERLPVTHMVISKIRRGITYKETSE